MAAFGTQRRDYYVPGPPQAWEGTMQQLRMRRATVTFALLLAATALWSVLGTGGLAGAELATTEESSHPIKLDIKGGEIGEVLRMLGRAAGVDIVVNDGVSGTVARKLCI